MSPRIIRHPEELSGRLHRAERDAEILRGKLFYAERARKVALGRARKADDDARFLHGVLLMHGIDPPERL